MKKIGLGILCYFAVVTTFAQKKEWVLATYTYSTNDRLVNLNPLAAWLSKKSGLSIRAVSYPTVQRLIDAIIQDSVDFAMMNTSGYLVLQKNNPGIVVPMVNLALGNDSSTLYGGCLVALKSRNIRSPHELKDKQGLSLALVNSSSTSGNLVPRLLLNKNNIPSAEDVFSVYYAGTHKKVAEDVLQGRAAIGGCGCAEIDSARLNRAFDEKAMIIDSFNNIPLGPVVRSRSVDTGTGKKVLSLLLKLHQSEPAVFRNFCDGWTEFKKAIKFKPVKDDEYNSFRAMFGKNDALWKLIE